MYRESHDGSADGVRVMEGRQEEDVVSDAVHASAWQSDVRITCLVAGFGIS